MFVRKVSRVLVTPGFLHGAALPRAARVGKRLIRRIPTVLLLGVSLLLLPACTPEEIDAFVEQNMRPDTNVDYADEGRIFVLHNHCLELADEEAYQECSLVEPVQIEGAITELEKTQVEEALPWVRRYRWITVNPSFTSVEAAKVIAAVQLKIMRWPGLVLVYLPQGPDKTRVDYDDMDSLVDETNRYLCGGFRIDHVDFRNVLQALVDGATQPDPEGLAPAEHLIVTAYSYSGPQTLRVVNDNRRVFYFNVAPSFGWQKWAGDEDWELPLGTLNKCIPQSNWASFHAMEDLNPFVGHYLDDLATAQSPQCLLNGFADCLTLGYHGSALTAPATSFPPELRVPCGDPYDDPEAEYNPNWPDFSPWCAAPPDYPGVLQYLGGDFRDDASWDFVNNTEACWFYGNDNNVIKAIQANLQSIDSIRMVTVETPSAEDDQTYFQSLTNYYGPEQPAGHFGYWTAGQPPPFDELPPNIERIAANWHFREFLQQCPALFLPALCPTCPDAEDWANGEYGAGTRIYWEQDPRTATGPPQSHPENELQDNDVLYVPVNSDLPDTSSTGGHDHALDELREKWGLLVAEESGQVSAIRNEANLQIRTVPPAARGVSSIEFWVDGAPLGTVGGTACDATTPQTTHPESWAVSDLFAPGGKYDDLAGAWFDVGTNWWDDRDPDACGSFDGSEYTSGDRRVLVMKLDVSSFPGPGEFADAFDAPVPDIRDTAFSSLDACSTGAIATQIYVHPASTLDSVEAQATMPSGTVALSGTFLWQICVDGLCSLYGTDMGYSFGWELLDVWCAEYPQDILCAGAEVHDTPVPVEFSVRATNTEGNFYFRDYEVEIERGPDADSDDWPDGCDNCPADANADQADFDGDSLGDACDTDDDQDGILDVADGCPFEDSTGSDADLDGCLDTFEGMTDLIGDLVDSGAIAEQLENSLTRKIANATRAADRGRVCAAINQLHAFQHQVEDQRNNKITDEAADLLVAYVENLIQSLLDANPGLECL